MPAYKNVSLSDLLLFKEYDGSEATRNSILWELGCDTKKEITSMVCEHRNLQGKVVTCEYFLCEERTDEKWLRGGYASLEAKIAASADPAKRHEMRKMSVQGYESKWNAALEEAVE